MVWILPLSSAICGDQGVDGIARVLGFQHDLVLQALERGAQASKLVRHDLGGVDHLVAPHPLQGVGRQPPQGVEERVDRRVQTAALGELAERRFHGGQDGQLLGDLLVGGFLPHDLALEKPVDHACDSRDVHADADDALRRSGRRWRE